MSIIIDNNYINNLLRKADKVIEDTKDETITNTKDETITNTKDETIKETIEVNTKVLNIDEDNNQASEELLKAQAKLKEIENIEGIHIKLSGVWIWIDGDTKAVKEELKAKGFKYASKKQMWYYNPNPYYRKKNSKTLSMAEIEQKYETTTIK